MRTVRKQLGRFKIIIAILIIALLVLGFILIRKSNQTTGLEGLSIETLQKRDVIRSVTADGNIAGLDERSVFLNPGKQVSEVRFSIGDHVNKDDTVLIYGGSNGFENVWTEVKSPIDGILTEINYKVDDVVGAANPIGFKVVDNSGYLINLDINENDIGDMAVGQSADVTIPAISLDSTYSGTVSSIDPDTSGQSGAVTYKVVVTPSNLPSNVRLGMSTNVSITTARVDNTLAVPESFVIEKSGQFFLKFLNYTDAQKTTYTVDEKQVTLGLTTNEYDEIKSGAIEGDQVVEPSFTPKSLGIFGN